MCKASKICNQYGFYTKYFSQEKVIKCTAELGDTWNGKCAYQQGNPISSPNEEVELNCCKNGCIMNAFEYANWNGKCSYQK